MQRKLNTKNVYNAGKGKTNQELIYLHMSSHYRRISNAKKVIDNSLPSSYKARRPVTSNPVAPKNKVNRSLESPVLTDRSLSTNSNKGSYWGTESYASSSRYHARCIPENSTFSTSSKQNPVNMNLVDQIAYDTKNGPATYSGEGWMKAKTQQKDTKQNKTETKFSPSVKRRLPTTGSQEAVQKRKLIIQNKLKSSGVVVKGSKSFSSVNKKFKPKTLKTEAVSKLRSLRVYYPPRRKKIRNETQNCLDAKITCPLEATDCKCIKICICDTNETGLKKISVNPKEQSLTSSRDSAYNGGVSSLPESRSPTPDERRKKECCCCCCEKKQRDVKLFESSKTTASRTESPRVPQQVSYAATPKSKSQEQQESLKKIQEDALYVNFIQDITTEVLEKNLYTNKALKKVMKKHMDKNLGKLSKDRMLKEVKKLRMQLGIPEDKTLLSLEADIDEDCKDISKFYPIISDSEFVMPKNMTAKTVKVDDSVMKTTNETPKSITTVLTSGSCLISETTDDDGEVISVINVTKAIREKRKERNVEKVSMMKNQENSSDDSDRVFDSKKQSVLKNIQQKLPRTYSYSSSDSDGSRKVLRKCRENTESEIFLSEINYPERQEQKSSSTTKKNRNVSFWKNPELNLTRPEEIKQKKTVSCFKESDISNFKPKKD